MNIRKPKIQFTGKTKYEFELLEALDIELSNGDMIHIPKGSVFDGKTIPRTWIQVVLIFVMLVAPIWLMWVSAGLMVVLTLIQRFGRDLIASIVHDWLYLHKTYSRNFSDRQLLFFQLAGGAHIFNVTVVYVAIRLGGWFLFYKNKKQ